VVLDEPFTGVDDITRAALLALLVERQSEAPVVLLTNAAEVLGWAIELPAADGTVAPADSLLNPLRSLADTQGTHPIRALREADPTAPTSPAHPAGRT
jgi:ABC-type taurine transport system ATPase subunit